MSAQAEYYSMGSNLYCQCTCLSTPSTQKQGLLLVTAIDPRDGVSGVRINNGIGFDRDDGLL